MELIGRKFLERIIKSKPDWYLLACVFFLIGLTSSRAILSISTVFIFFYGIARIGRLSNYKELLRFPNFIFPVIYIVLAFSYFNTTEVSVWKLLLLHDLPMLLLATGITLAPKPEPGKIRFLAIFFGLLCLVIALATAIRFWDAGSQGLIDISESKSIASVTGLSHIQFGFLMSMACIINLIIFLESKQKLSLAIFMGLFLIMHLLAYRSAIFLTYISLLAIGFYQMVKEKQVLKVLYVSAGLAVFLLCAYSLIPAVRVRTSNTLQDFSQMTNHRNPNNYSLSQRFSASKATMEIIRKNVMIGVGAADLNLETQRQYNENSYLLIPENRILVHNQFLYYWASYGIVFLLFFAGFFLKLLKDSWTRHSLLLFCLVILVLSSFLVDNMLNKQIGFSVIIFWLLLSYPQNAGVLKMSKLRHIFY